MTTAQEQQRQLVHARQVAAVRQSLLRGIAYRGERNPPQPPRPR